MWGDGSVKKEKKLKKNKKCVGITENSTKFPVETQREGNLTKSSYLYVYFILFGLQEHNIVKQ